MITKPFVCVLLMVCAGAASAAEPACVTVEQGWVRVSQGPMPMSAGYGVIRNNCKAPVVVVAADSTAFGDVSLHQTTLVDGISRMRAVERLPIAPGASAELKPGGLHLMLMQPQAPLSAGAVVPLQLRLEDGRKVDGTLTARTP
ncbi:copper chaperone PCu(A)C [Stenotrophomonas sp. ISL-67]|uniref:copper chaperone PCu(A)C n=1 Tax=Stenotrophomonas sp. ISL-67 TaxID=2819171 RepID=UPI001BE73E59|nr:copper chaperone PCu(A)C [Stenotrophomonas sp. ISL-67]MBT2766330.1 copper chaperone PCu(A)C [Stenotrophomonas sp. ISL-67]